MIYQLLPESPKSGSNLNQPCRYVGYKFVSCLAIASFALYTFFVAPNHGVGDMTRNGFLNIARKGTARDVSSGPVIYKTEFSHESNHSWEDEWGPVEKIVLLGERHSGTNWITHHLQDCFAHSIQVRSFVNQSITPWYAENSVVRWLTGHTSLLKIQTLVPKGRLVSWSYEISRRRINVPRSI